MQIIPVLDLQHGQVVRAVRGERAAYRPIDSALTASSEPLVVAPILLARCASHTLYVADLDALMGGRPQQALLLRLLDRLPGVSVWLDGGFRDRAMADRSLEMLGREVHRMTPVFASESLRSREALAQACAPGARSILSLDQRAGSRLDAAGCWDAVALWPERVISMTLDRVGAASGPDLGTVAQLRKLAPAARLIGAGGIRDASDLAAARDSGADAWLVASALHDLRLP